MYICPFLSEIIVMIEMESGGMRERERERTQRAEDSIKTTDKC
jgi:hypothetical protein